MQNYPFKIAIPDSSENIGQAFIADETASNLPSINGGIKCVNRERFSQISH